MQKVNATPPIIPETIQIYPFQVQNVWAMPKYIDESTGYYFDTQVYKNNFHLSGHSEDIGIFRILKSDWSRAYPGVPDQIYMKPIWSPYTAFFGYLATKKK